jgi:hypothetical protein
MLFEKLFELIVALAVAAAGLAGIGNAAEHADPRANETAVTHAAAPVDETATIKAATALARAADVLVELDAVGPTDGLAQAAEALNQAMENAPDQADQGLERAMEAVTMSPANDAPAGPPADPPGGRP